jgi:hypothetical protein
MGTVEFFAVIVVAVAGIALVAYCSKDFPTNRWE